MKITGFKKVFYYINDLGRKYIDDGCTMFAAAISYYTIFSIFPIILIVFSLSSAFFARSAFLDTVQNFIRENIPMISDFVLANIEGVIKNIVGIGALGLVFFVYGASSYGILFRNSQADEVHAAMAGSIGRRVDLGGHQVRLCILS
jgi:YihY family inner membrane protein